MRKIGGIVGHGSTGALHEALERLERSREAQGREMPPEPLREPHTGPERAQDGAGSIIRSLAGERAERQRQKAGELIALARSCGIHGEALEIIQRTAADAQKTKEAWTFVMISPEQNAAVVDWLSANSKRPQVAMRVWAKLFAHLRTDTGEIMQTRQELADRVGITAQNLSRIMTELETINAIRRQKKGREVRYFMNPTIATHLPDKARNAAQAKAGPLLMLMEGGCDT